MSKAVIQAGNRKVPETDGGYANARMRGMRANLLPTAFFDRLIVATDVGQVVKELMTTEYGPDLEAELVHGRTAAVIDGALKDNMVRAYQKVLSFLHPSARTLLSTLLGRWDVFNIKTIIRGAHNKVPLDEMKASFFPAGYLSEEELEALAQFDDVGAVINTMAMWGLPYATPLRQAFPSYTEDHDLSPLELALDKQYTSWASGRLTGRSQDTAIARRILGMQIDTANLVTVLRLLKADTGDLRAKDYFLEGGMGINQELFLELAAMSDVDEVLDRLKRTKYASVLDEAAIIYLERNSITVFERALEDQLMRRALSAGVNDPHGVGVAIAYLYGKQNEITNLRIVVKGISVGMPPDRVREELILV